MFLNTAHTQVKNTSSIITKATVNLKSTLAFELKRTAVLSNNQRPAVRREAFCMAAIPLFTETAIRVNSPQSAMVS